VLTRFLHLVTAVLTFVLGGGTIATAQDAAPPGQAVSTGIAFVHARLIRMDTERVDAGQTVLVRDGRIAFVGDSGAAELPHGTTVIDASGYYVLPGLTDAHVHLTTDMPWARVRRDFGDAPLYLATGVVAIARRWRKRAPPAPVVSRIHLLCILSWAASLFGAISAFLCLPVGPLFDSVLLRAAFTAFVLLATAASAVALVLTPAIWRQTGTAATVRWHTGLTSIASCTVAATGLIFWVPVAWRSSDYGIDQLAQRIHDAEIIVQTTLVNYDAIGGSGRTRLLNDPTIDYLHPDTRARWRRQSPEGPPLYRYTLFLTKVVGALHRAGVPLMSGTDAMGVPLVAPGSSLHHELELLVASGLTPFEAIRTATVVPARFLRKEAEFGTVTAGSRAVHPLGLPRVEGAGEDRGPGLDAHVHPGPAGAAVRAAEQGAEVVQPAHVLEAKKVARTLEQQLADKIIERRKEYEVIVTTGEKIGRVNGLAVLGGETGIFSGIILPIEAQVAAGGKAAEIIATGKLGEIAKEAVRNVSAIIKSYFGEDIKGKYDLYVQFLQTYEGVEGDSASIAVATAVISALEKVPVRQDTAMTGSLTVRGDVLPIGGVSAKVEAALEAGLKQVIVPRSNMNDIVLDKAKLAKIKITPVDNIIDVLKAALNWKGKEKILQKIKR